jgi:hypothetical protein
MFDSDDTVRLLVDFPDLGLQKGKDCRVVRVVAGPELSPGKVELAWVAEGASRQATVPLDAVQPVLSKSTEQRTAVLWGLGTPPEEFIEASLHSVMDRGFEMASGLNAVELHYNPQERWWRWGEPMSDPAGAHIATAGPRWDGGVAAFGGRERFHIEFRLRARGGPCILLHEASAAYEEQRESSPAAMNLARVLMDLKAVSSSEYCAFPAADPWLYDEDWRSLLRPPYYPDLFLLPETEQIQDLPPEFRGTRLSQGGMFFTTLPVKFAPHDEPPKLTDRDRKLNSLRKCASLGEKYYDQMYETRLGTTGLYSSVKDAFLDAISVAGQLGLKDRAEALDKRLEHIKAVFRTQFS